jgi:hypothetical protein
MKRMRAGDLKPLHSWPEPYMAAVRADMQSPTLATGIATSYWSYALYPACMTFSKELNDRKALRSTDARGVGVRDGVWQGLRVSM